MEGYHFSIEDIRKGYFPTKTGGWNRNLGRSLLVEKRFEERRQMSLRTKNKRSVSSLCPNLSSSFTIYLPFCFTPCAWLWETTRGLIHELFDVKGFNFFPCRFLSIEKRLIHTRSKIHLNSHWKKLVFSLANGLRCKQSYRRKKVPHFASRIFVCKIRWSRQPVAQFVTKSIDSSLIYGLKNKINK